MVHPSKAMCVRSQESKRKLLAAEETQSGVEAVVLQEHGCYLTMVSSFKYLGGFLMAADDNWEVAI